MLLHREKKHHVFTTELMLPHFHHSSVCASVSDEIQGSIKTKLSFKSYLKVHYLLPTPCLQDSDGGVDLHLVMGHLCKLIHFFCFPLQVLQFLHMNHNTEEIAKILHMYSTQTAEQ